MRFVSAERFLCNSKMEALVTTYATVTAFRRRHPLTICKASAATREIHLQKTHSMPLEKVEIFRSLDAWANTHILPLLKPVESCWQPQDMLPHSSSESFLEEVRDLRERSRELPDEYLVCLVGDMITEEALPTYQTMLNRLDGVHDETGASATAWAQWSRQWTAEENRHGDALNKYLFFTGRVDMRQIEKTIQYLIGSGMDTGMENNPYMGFTYTSFQERATAISHRNTARMAREKGETALARLCGIISSDEKRHEAAYEKMVEKLLEVDPDYTILAIYKMMKRKITMPAHFLFDGQDRNLFHHYSSVAQRIGVYTAGDYADIVEYLVSRWNLEKLEDGLSGAGRKARDFVCSLPPRIRRLQELNDMKAKRSGASASEHMLPFSWVFNREVPLDFP